MDPTSVPHVAAGNRDQLSAWDGDQGGFWADHADRFDRAVADYHRLFMTAAAIGTREHVLDVGCGAGRVSLDAARAADAGSVLGVDLSAALLAVARRRAEAESVRHVRFVQGDAQVHPFEPDTFDVAVSRTGAMFFADPVAAFANVGRAMHPGGRLVLLTWQPPPENPWISSIAEALAVGRHVPPPPTDGPGLFSLSDPLRVHTVLEDAGFTDVELEGRPGTTWFGTDADDADRFALGLFGGMLDGLEDVDRRHALEGLRALMDTHQTSDGVRLASAAWIVRARRRS